jgi:hypothetical protein
MHLHDHGLFRLVAQEPSADVSDILKAERGDGLFGYNISRTSILSRVSCCSADNHLCQSANFSGYFDIPNSFTCAFVGGWLFATPSFLSMFYACAIALNTQLVFVHRLVPKDDKQILYLVIPPILALLICGSLASFALPQLTPIDLLLQPLLL